MRNGKMKNVAQKIDSEKGMTARSITLTGIMAAAVYMASAFLQIPVPTAIGSTRIHMGNVMCLLSGMVLDPVSGGLAAGIGSMFFDLTNPAYVMSAPFTFVFKFVMAWLCGTIVSKAEKSSKPANAGLIVGGAAGAFVYVLLYLTKNFVESRYVLHLPPEAVMLTIAQKCLVSGVNGIIAVIVAVPLGRALRQIRK